MITLIFLSNSILDIFVAKLRKSLHITKHSHNKIKFSMWYLTFLQHNK